MPVHDTTTIIIIINSYQFVFQSEKYFQRGVFI